MGGLFACLMLREHRAGFWELVDRFAIPAVVTAFLPLVLPLSHATGGNYYYGARTLADAAMGLAQVLFVPAIEGRARFGIELLPFERLWIAAPVAAVLVLLAAFAAAARAAQRFRQSRDSERERFPRKRSPATPAPRWPAAPL